MKQRCAVCNVKLGLSDFYVCRCNGVFCKLHRYDSEHKCSYNYYEESKNRIEKLNPKVIAPKLEKI